VAVLLQALVHCWMKLLLSRGMVLDAASALALVVDVLFSSQLAECCWSYQCVLT
jgi:hypothetical protein